MDNKQIGWTAPGFEPAYLNFFETDAGEIAITVRGARPSEDAAIPHAHMAMPKEEFLKFLEAARAQWPA